MRWNIIGEPIQTSQACKRYTVTLRMQSSKNHQYTPAHLGNRTVMAVSIGAQFGSPHWTSWTVTITPCLMVGGMSMSDHSSTRAIPALRSATACGSSAGCPGINMAYCVAGCYQGVRDSSIGLVLCGEGPGWRVLWRQDCACMVAGRRGTKMRGCERRTDLLKVTGEKFGRRDWRVAPIEQPPFMPYSTLNPNRCRIEPPPSYIDNERDRRIHR